MGKGKPGPQPLDPALKALRGTVKASRERRRTADPTPVPKPHSAPQRELPDYVAIARQYVADVLDGRIVACRPVRLLAQRQVADLSHANDTFTDLSRRNPSAVSPENEKASDFPYVWSDAQAIDICAFCESLPLALGQAGLLRLRPVQVFLLTLWFGWRLRADLTVRRFRFIHLEVARKFGKSTLTAAIGLYGLVKEGEHGARIVIAATAGQQTEHVFGTMRFMAASAFLRDQGVRVFQRAIVHEESNSKIEALNSRAHSLHGSNPSVVIIDELHEVPHALFNVLRTAFGARKNPLLMVLTTAGRDIFGIAYETRQRVLKVLEGALKDDRLSGAVFTLDDGDDWRDESIWPKANPMLDDPTPTLSELRQLALEAKHTPSQEMSFRQFYGNQWLQLSASAWLSPEDIRACVDPSICLEDFEGEPIWIGFDSALKDDSASVAIVALRDGVLFMFAKSFLPADSVDRYAHLIPEYRQWVKDGLLEATEGAIVDLARIRDYIASLHERFQVRGVVIEMFAAGNLPSDLQRMGLPVEVAQKTSKSFTPSALDLDARIRTGLFRYDGNSHATWMLLNACVERRVDGSLLPKKESEKSIHKIDIVDATLLAMMPMVAEPEPVEYRILAV